MFSLPTWLLVFPVVGFLILIHEAGHFATAKWLGIKVVEFGFGFPPRIFGIPFKGTIYSINWIPMGGFVRFVGGEEDPTELDSFARHSVAKRALVIVAGSFVNLALPVVIFTVLFMLPHETLVGGSVVITGVAPRSPAQEAGLRAGDTVLSAGGQAVISVEKLVAVVRANVGRSVELSVRRAPVVSGLGSSPELMVVETVRVTPRQVAPRLKVVEVVTDRTTEVSLSEASRYDSGLQIGDTLTQRFIGVRIGLTNPKFGRTSDPIWRAVPSALTTVKNIVLFTWNGISDAISTRSNPGLAGPIGIAQATGEGVEELGFGWIFLFMAVISLSLGIVNLLPVPALDGGRLMFVLLEWVRRGKRISPKREGLVHLVGFAILIGLVLVMSYFDVLRLLKGESFLR